MTTTALLSAVAVFAMTAAAFAEDAPVAAKVGEAKPVNLGAFGANNNNATAQNQPAEPAYRALIKALGATHMRYIGGSSASFWDWRTGKYVPADEITTIWPAEHGNWMLPLVAEVDQLPDGTLAPSNYADFAEAAGVDVQWMVNLTTREDDQAAMFEQLKQAGSDVKFVELDNETYFWGGEFGGGEDRARNYMDRAAPLGRAIREIYPDARIGVVASENGMFNADMHGDGKSEEHFTLWNGVVMRDEYAGSFDAFILHHYVMRDGALDDMDTTDPAALGQAFLTCPQLTLERAAARLDDEFGGVPMWITEYNVIAYYTIAELNRGGGAADEWMLSTQNTPWNAIYQAGFWLTALQQPEAIEVLNHHSISNVSLGWGLGLERSETEADLTATGQLFAHLAHLARDSKTAAAVEFEEVPQIVGFEAQPADALQGVLLSGDSGRRMIVINRSAQPVTVAQDEVASASTYHAMEDAAATARVQFDGDLAVWQQGPMTASPVDAAQGQITLPPFSLTIAHLRPID